MAYQRHDMWVHLCANDVAHDGSFMNGNRMTNLSKRSHTKSQHVNERPLIKKDNRSKCHLLMHSSSDDVIQTWGSKCLMQQCNHCVITTETELYSYLIGALWEVIWSVLNLHPTLYMNSRTGFPQSGVLGSSDRL